MAVYTRETARANVRVLDGHRVFYLDSRDHLTPSARQWLQDDGVEILPASKAKPTGYTTLSGVSLTKKPEHMTHLHEAVLVEKDHPRIAFRGMVDALEAEILLCAKAAGVSGLRQELEEILTFVRSLIRCDVLEEPVGEFTLCGMTPDELRQRSHLPQRYYGQPHFMPSVADSGTLLHLNRLRTLVRQTELAAYKAFRTADGDVTRPDIILAFNRLSSLVWIMMIRLKKEEDSHGNGT